MTRGSSRPRRSFPVHPAYIPPTSRLHPAHVSLGAQSRGKYIDPFSPDTSSHPGGYVRLPVPQAGPDSFSSPVHVRFEGDAHPVPVHPTPARVLASPPALPGAEWRSSRFHPAFIPLVSRLHPECMPRVPSENLRGGRGPSTYFRLHFDPGSVEARIACCTPRFACTGGRRGHFHPRFQVFSTSPFSFTGETAVPACKSGFRHLSDTATAPARRSEPCMLQKAMAGAFPTVAVVGRRASAVAHEGDALHDGGLAPGSLHAVRLEPGLPPNRGPGTTGQVAGLSRNRIQKAPEAREAFWRIIIMLIPPALPAASSCGKAPAGGPCGRPGRS